MKHDQGKFPFKTLFVCVTLCCMSSFGYLAFDAHCKYSSGAAQGIVLADADLLPPVEAVAKHGTKIVNGRMK